MIDGLPVISHQLSVLRGTVAQWGIRGFHLRQRIPIECRLTGLKPAESFREVAVHQKDSRVHLLGLETIPLRRGPLAGR